MSKTSTFMPREGEHRPIVYVVTAIACGIALLHLYAAFFPSGMWGVHHLSFFPIPLGIGVASLMLLMAFPSVQDSILSILNKIVGRFNKLSHGHRRMALAGIVLAMTVLFWLGRESTFFLGDGNLILRNLPGVSSSERIPKAFVNEPFAGFIIWKAYKLLTWLNLNPAGELAVRFVSIVFGCSCLVLIFSVSRRIALIPLDRLLVYGLVLVSGGTQLLFGYVENYAPTYFCILLFLLLSIEYLRGGVHLAVPCVIFGVLFSLHFGMLAFFPSVLFLVYREATRKKTANIAISFIAMTLTVVLLLWLCGYSVRTFLKVLQASNAHLVPISAGAQDAQSYALFSFTHFLDVANLQLLLSPFSLLAVATISILYFRRISFREPEWLFFLLTTVCGLGFTFVVNCDIGVSRDWDMLASFSVGIIMAAAFGIIHFVDDAGCRHRLLVLMTSITLLHTLPWILVNTYEKTSVAQFEQLQHDGLWGRRALAYSNEELAIFFRDRKDSTAAIKYYQNSLEADSTNYRIWESLGLIYHRRGDIRNAMMCYQEAVNHGTPDAWVYRTLGDQWGRDGHYDDAIFMLEKSLSLDPSSATSNELMGTALYLSKGDYQTALMFFLQAIKLDSNLTKAYFDVGVCYRTMKRPEQVKFYWQKYLERVPHGEHTNEVRQILGLTH
ncbi:MAG: tetratricopeptide repeat protein [Bacteroidota bacterium]|jgi:Tfp pilus assembly protein PilF